MGIINRINRNDRASIYVINGDKQSRHSRSLLSGNPDVVPAKPVPAGSRQGAGNQRIKYSTGFPIKTSGMTNKDFCNMLTEQ